MVDLAFDHAAIRRLPQFARRILRCRPHDIEAPSKIIGLALPRAAYGSASLGGRHALWLGPDEWLILDEAAGADRLACAGKPLAEIGAAFVDIGHRQLAFAITGSEVETWLASGCPLDLSPAVFPVGACSRTVFHKAEIVLWRTGIRCFHLEVWRSFATYVETLLTDARPGVDE